jgi:hypothetical protein
VFSLLLPNLCPCLLHIPLKKSFLQRGPPDYSA